MTLAPGQPHHERIGALNASDLGAILGAQGAYRSAADVYAVKLGLAPDEANAPAGLLRIGLALEPAALLVAARAAADYEPGTVEPAPFFRHSIAPLQGHPDALWGASTILEAKVASHGAATMTTQWELQARAYLALTGRQRVVFGLLSIPDRLPVELVGSLIDQPSAAETLEAVRSLRGASTAVHVFDRDLRIERALLAKASDWWRDHVVARRPPLDGSRTATLGLLAAHGPAAAKRIRRADELGDLVTDLAAAQLAAKSARAAADEAERRRDELGQQVMAQIGDDHGIRAGGLTVTWSRWTVTRTDLTRLRAERPEVAAILDEYTQTRPEGRLYVRAG